MEKNNVFRKIAGVGLIFFGTIGLFLPFLQGILMITAGIYLLDNNWITGQFKRIFSFFRTKT